MLNHAAGYTSFSNKDEGLVQVLFASKTDKRSWLHIILQIAMIDDEILMI